MKRVRWNRFEGTPLPPNTARVMRPGRYGSPFPITPTFSREESVRAYTLWIMLAPEGRACLERAREELRGMDLACACPLDEPCHADVLAELVNMTDAELDRACTQATVCVELGSRMEPVSGPTPAWMRWLSAES